MKVKVHIKVPYELDGFNEDEVSIFRIPGMIGTNKDNSPMFAAIKEHIKKGRDSEAWDLVKEFATLSQIEKIGSEHWPLEKMDIENLKADPDLEIEIEEVE